VDWSWWAKDAREREFKRPSAGIFRVQGFSHLWQSFTLDGRQLAGEHSTGLVAMNAWPACAAPSAVHSNLVEALWNTPVPAGQWRYYDGMLLLLAMLHCGGEFRIWSPQWKKRNGRPKAAEGEASPIAGGSFRGSSCRDWSLNEAQGTAAGSTGPVSVNLTEFRLRAFHVALSFARNFTTSFARLYDLGTGLYPTVWNLSQLPVCGAWAPKISPPASTTKPASALGVGNRRTDIERADLGDFAPSMTPTHRLLSQYPMSGNSPRVSNWSWLP